MLSIRTTCRPRPEVLQSELQDALFAASFAQVTLGEGARVYVDPHVFFRNTHPAHALSTIVRTVFERLVRSDEPGVALRLSTGFGGGKTHALIALWHLARNVSDPTLGTDLLAAAGRPPTVAVVGIDASGWGRDVAVRHPDAISHSLWGELAYQLSGREGLERLGPMDAADRIPDIGLLRQLLPEGPLLILIDELVIYMSNLSEQEAKQVVNFVGMLVSVVTSRAQAVLVITDPANQDAYADQSERLAKALDVATKLDSVLSRAISDYDPIGDETAQVISRRLFEHVDRAAADTASSEYFAAYQRVVSELPAALPTSAATHDYAERIVRCYPFHPRLMATAQDRLSSIQDFNRSRGVLRLFARMLRDIWSQQRDPYLLSAGELNWADDRIQADLLHRLNRDSFRGAVDADVLGHAAELDKEYGTDIHRRVASALLLESLPMSGDTMAMDRRDLTLAVLRPSEMGSEPSQALDRLVSVCWHTYHDASREHFEFRYEPNIHKIIEERAPGIPLEDARQRLLTMVLSNFQGGMFRVVSYPTAPSAVADGAVLTLVLADDEALARRVVEFQNEPQDTAPFPRRFRNAIVAIAPRTDVLEQAIATERRLLAANELLTEHRRDKGPREVRDQIEAVINDLGIKVRREGLRAFERVLLQGRQTLTLSEDYMVTREGPLDVASGQERLLKFLEDKRLIFKVGDALDVGLLVERLLPGGTPDVAHPGAVRADSVYERALESKDLRLMRNGNPVSDAILRAVSDGRLVVRLANGQAHDATGCVAGPPGARLRAERPLASVPLESDVLLAPPDAPCVMAWLRTDEPQPKSVSGLLTLEEAARRKRATVAAVEEALRLGLVHGQMVDGVPHVLDDAAFALWFPSATLDQNVTAYSWDEAVRYAATRPLLSVTLKASEVDAANRLLSAAHPLGVPRQALRLQLEGQLRDGGSLNLAFDDVPPNAPVNPVEQVRRLARACQVIAYFEGELRLLLGQGQRNMQALLQQSEKQAGGVLTIEALFGPEEGDHA